MRKMLISSAVQRSMVRALAMLTLPAVLIIPSAKADLLFIGSQNGECCFDVDIQNVSSAEVKITVSLTDSATYFVNTGHGNHPGFAFNVDETITTPDISNVSSPWASSDVHLSSVSTGGPSFGTFDYYIDNPGSGASDHNGGPLIFDITVAGGISATDFVANGSGYYFTADILGSDGNTGESGIDQPGTPSAVPEPTAIAFFGTGLLAAGFILRKKLKPNR